MSDIPAERLYAAYRIHTTAHEALTLQKQVIHMTIDSIKRGPPRRRMLRAFARDAAKIRELAERIEKLATDALELRPPIRRGSGNEKEPK